MVTVDMTAAYDQIQPTLQDDRHERPTLHDEVDQELPGRLEG